MFPVDQQLIKITSAQELVKGFLGFVIANRVSKS